MYHQPYSGRYPSFAIQGRTLTKCKPAQNMGKGSEREMTRVWPVHYLLSVTLFHINLHRPGPLHSITPVLLQSGGFMCNRAAVDRTP